MSSGLLHRKNIDEKGASEEDGPKSDEKADGDNVPNNKEEVYNRLYAILCTMTLLLFVINIVQVCILPINPMTNLYWIVLTPLLIFVAFLAWAGALVQRNWWAFRGRALVDEKEAARLHVRNLFDLDVPRRKSSPKSSREEKGEENEEEGIGRAEVKGGRTWPRRSGRASVIITIILNVILVEFVYLPVFALPDFKKITWHLTLHTHRTQMTPAVAVVENLNTTATNQAILSTDSAVWDKLCDERKSDDSNGFSRCFNSKTAVYIEDAPAGARVRENQLRYALFEPERKSSDLSSLNVYSPIGLWYPWKFDFNDGARVPSILITFLDPGLADDFQQAVRCGLQTQVQVNPLLFNNIRLRSTDIRDQINAMHRSGDCNTKKFERYRSYEPSLSVLNPKFTGNGNVCDTSNPGFNGDCYGAVQITYESQLSSIYESVHGKNWITILTEEGGVVGFVTFLTWFLGIFEM